MTDKVHRKLWKAEGRKIFRPYTLGIPMTPRTVNSVISPHPKFVEPVETNPGSPWPPKDTLSGGVRPLALSKRFDRLDLELGVLSLRCPELVEGSKGQGKIGVRFDKLNELGDGKIP